MLEAMCNSFDYDDAEEHGVNIKSLCKRRRKWQRLSEMLSKIASGTTINGVYLDLNKKGYKRRCEIVCISDSLPDNFSLNTALHGFVDYIWSNTGRFVRAKNRNCSSKQKKRHNLQSKKVIVKEENEEEKENIPENKTSSRKEDDLEDSDSSDGEDSWDDEIIERKSPRKQAPRSLRYLYSDAYIKERCSKRRTTHLKSLVEDIILVPNIKPKRHSQRRNLYPCDHSKTNEEDESDSVDGEKLVPITLGDFFSLELFSKFCLKHKYDSRIMHCIKEDQSVDSYTSQSSENIIGDVNDNISGRISPSKMSIDEDSNLETPCNGNLIYNAGISNHINEEDFADDPQESQQNGQNSQSIVLLSRAAIRPDNLRLDFKMNYKEAQCKPRRFIINISHLVYQNFVLTVTEPLHIIPELDLSMYLVFSFVTEGKDGIDKYRVDINTTLPMKNQKNVLAPLCQRETVSVHEIMQSAIKALEFIEIWEIKKRKKINLNDDINHKAIQSFNLLTTACKWNIEYMNCPHLLEWSDGIDNNANFMNPDSFSNDNGGLFQSKGNFVNAVFSKQRKETNVSMQGPNKPYLCGICLKDFNENNSSFPLAICSCSHWFCENCWKASFQFPFNKTEHLYELTCIEEGCTSVIDLTSLLSLLPVHVVRDYELWRWEIAIENTPSVKLCPNPSCRNIIFAKNNGESNDLDQNINITCSCLFQKCFSCMSSPHWPVSCAVAKIYQRRMDALNHDNFNRLLEDKELPATVLKGKSCPKCGNNIQVNFKYFGLKRCICGCVICWSCGKEVNESQENLHASCTQKFQIEDQKLKQRLNCQEHNWVRNDQMTRWYKLALLHRQNRHPQVVSILYKMANHVAEAISELLCKGKYVGNVKQAASGWKSHFRKLACERLKLLQANANTKQGVEKNESNIRDLICLTPVDNNESFNDWNNSPRPNSSISLTPEPLQIESHTVSDSYPRRNQNLQCDPLLKKAISSIVDAKLELHQIIEYTAIFLEYSHALQQPGKVIRCLERAEDLCTCLDMLLQPVHVEGSSRIIPSFLRLRTQIVSALSNLQCCLKDNLTYRSKKNDKKL